MNIIYKDFSPCEVIGNHLQGILKQSGGEVPKRENPPLFITIALKWIEFPRARRQINVQSTLN